LERRFADFSSLSLVIGFFRRLCRNRFANSLHMRITHAKKGKEVQGTVDSLEHQVALLFRKMRKQLLSGLVFEVELLKIAQLALKSRQQRS
jgi:hypothetical protein